jgi:hypothetical protein
MEVGMLAAMGKGKLVAFLAGIATVGAIGATVATRDSGAKTAEVVVPSGTTFVAALGQSVSTKTDEAGTPVTLETVAAVALADGFVVPAGTRIRGEVTHAKGGGRLGGGPELTIRFQEILVDGEEYRIGSEPFRIRGKGDTKETVAEIGGGALLGGVIGGVTGAGVVEGAAVGAVLGTGVAVATKGDDLTIAKGQQLRIRLSEPVTVTLPVPEDAKQ